MCPVDAVDPVVDQVDPVDCIADLAAAALERAAPGRPVVVALDGRSGAGKTTLAAEVADEIAGRGTCPDPTVLTMEDLYRGWRGLKAGVEMWRRDVLPALLAGGPVTYRPWDWHRDAEGPLVVVEPAPVVIAEGFGTAAGTRDGLDVLVWVEAPIHVRRVRALARDGGGYEPNWILWAKQEDVSLARRHPADVADVVVVSDASRRWVRRGPVPRQTAPADSRVPQQ